jgi:hypothetical protein
MSIINSIEWRHIMTLENNSSPIHVTQPTKITTTKKKDPFYGTEAFKKMLLDALATVADVNPAEDHSKRVEYYLSMAESALQRESAPIETMLMTQACTLDLLFNKCMRIARNCEFLNGTEIYSNMAFKAQKQCRQTLRALHEVQHPRRTTFVNQQNNALNQQVNNNSTKEDFQKNSANELLTEVQYEKMDTGRTVEAVAAHP